VIENKGNIVLALFRESSYNGSVRLIDSNEMEKLMKTLTVYLLVDATPYESHETLGVYFTKEDAMAAAEKFKSEDCNYYDECIEFDILEVEIGGDPMYSFRRNSEIA
jgi:hypothetical protein